MARLAIVMVVAVGMVGLLSLYAQDSAPAGRMPPKGGPHGFHEGGGPCPACMMIMGDIPPERMKMMMGRAGISDEMMKQVQVMRATVIDMSAPRALLAQGDELKLSADQKAALEQIVKDSGAKALAVLTDDQKKLVAAGNAATMQEMSVSLHEKMRDAMEKMRPR